MTDMTLLDRILGPDGLRALFQPVFRHRDGGWQIYAVEALARGPEGTNAERADVLFEYVRRKREEARVDRVCIARLLEAARELPWVPALSVNVHASTLGRDRDFADLIASCAAASDIDPSRLVVEIVEHAPSRDVPAFRRSLEELRALGVRIALDDIGLGQSNYQMILECRPDVFKIDRYLVKGAAYDFHRQATLRSIADLASSFGGCVVAEGVDNYDDLEAVLAAGINLIQGYLLGGPMTAAELTARDMPWTAPKEQGCLFTLLEPALA